MLEEARVAIDAEDCKGALKLLRKADRAFEGRSADVHLLTGQCAYRLGDFQEAVEAAGRALEMELAAKKRAEVLELRALGRLGFCQASRQERMAAVNQGGRGRLTEAGRKEMAERFATTFERVEADLREALELGGDEVNQARYYLAQVLGRLRKDEEALELLQQYLERGASPETEETAAAMRCLLDRRLEIKAEKKDGPPVELGDVRPGDVEAPKRIRQAWPQYTEAALRAQLRGRVILEGWIDERGEIRCAFPLEGLPLGMTEAAVEALRDWKFEPARKKGEPTAMLYHLTISFSPR